MKSQNCPRCGSPDPKKHPAVQFEGEVQVCEHPWHRGIEVISQSQTQIGDVKVTMTFGRL